VSHRPFRSTLVTVASGLAAAIAISWVCGPAPARAAAGYSAAGRGVQAQEWWLGGLHVRQTWPSTQGTGITVAVLGTGVDPRHPDLTGSVATGPDFSGSGRTQAGPFWGINGTEVAGAIAGHGHGTGRTDGLLGVAPMAKILSIRVSLEFNDPLNSTRAIARRLPGAIASGIIYAVDHGARIIDLPLDPGTAGLTGQGSPAAAGGSPAEKAAVAYALRKNVVLVAPAGDDGQGPDLTDHPAAYTGVIAVGAVARNGRLAPFSSRHSYVSLTAPGVGLAAAVPPDDYARISSTSTSSGIVAGVAALIRSRFPHLSAVQVGQALTGGTTVGSATGRTSAPGTGRGTIDAAKAVGVAASINAAAEPPRPAPTARPSQSEQRLSTTAAHRANASELAGSLVRYVVAGLCVLIVLLVALLLVMRSRRERSSGFRLATAEAVTGRTRPRGQHEQRLPRPVSGPVTEPVAAPLTGHQGSSRSQLAPPPGRAGAGGWAAAGGWQGGSSLGEMQPPPAEPFRPVIAPAPKPARTAATAAPSPASPPWAPAPEPERTFGPLPSVPNSAFPPDPGPGIRVPADVPAMPAAPPGGMLPSPFDVNASPDPDFPPRPVPDGEPGLGRPTRQSLGFAAAPVPVDYAPPQAPDFTVPSRAAGLVLSGDTAPSAARGASAAVAAPGPAPVSAGPAEDPSFIWDLAATDVFPAAGDPGAQTAAPGAVPQDGDPGAS
jgi:Subtilase family